MSHNVEIEVLESLHVQIEAGDEKTKKLFQKQKQFMSINPLYPSLGRKRLKNVQDKYGNDLWEIRLDRKRRIVFVEREKRIIWLKICTHDEIMRNNVIRVKDQY